MNKTILIGIPSLLVGGTEYQTLRLVQALNTCGYHCVTVCYFEYDFHIVQQFKLAGSEVECLSAWGTRPEGIRKTYKMLYSGLKRTVDSYHPDMAHIQYVAPGAIPIVILRKLGVKRIIATLHSDADIYKNLRLIHFLQRHVAKVFTCVSLSAEKNFFGNCRLFDANTIISKHNHFTIHNCLPAKHSFGTPHAFSDGIITIGVVSRLVQLKGVELVMPAFAQLIHNHDNIRIIIVGDGVMHDEMQRQQKTLCIDDSKVQWLGTVDHSKLFNIYRSIDILWMPSYTEGFGLSALEAMSQGCVVVATKTGGLVDVVHDGVDGRLIEKGNINDLAQKTSELVTSHDKLTTMSINAISNSQQFSFDKYKEKIYQLYSKLFQ